MKLYLFIAVMAFASCEPSNEQKTLDWIKKAHKPVVVEKKGWSSTGRIVYYLTDSDGCQMVTPEVSLSLGDTIK